MSSIVSRKHLYVESSHRNSGSINDFIIDLNDSWTYVPPGQKLLIGVTDATIPYYFHNVGADTIKFTFYYYTGSAYSSTLFTADAGNYTAFQVASTIETFIKTVDANATVVYDTIRNQYVFNSTTSSTAANNNKIMCFSQSVADFLGFADTSLFLFGKNNELRTTKPISVLTTTDLYIRTNISTLNIHDNQISDILVKIPIDVPPFSNICYNNHATDNRITFNQGKLNFLQVKITDSSNVAITMDLDWSLTFTLEYHKLEEASPIPRGLARMSQLLEMLITQGEIGRRKQKTAKKKSLAKDINGTRTVQKRGAQAIKDRPQDSKSAR